MTMLFLLTFLVIFSSLEGCSDKKNKILKRIFAFNKHLTKKHKKKLHKRITDNQTTEQLCRIARRVALLLPQEYLTNECPICFDTQESPVSKKNLICCGTLICLPCLRKTYARHIADNYRQATFSCPFCRRNIFNFKKKNGAWKTSTKSRIFRRLLKSIIRKKHYAQILLEAKKTR